MCFKALIWVEEMSKNYLSENQKNLVRQWISEGLSNQQIVIRASEQKPPFKLTVQNVDRNYRKPIKPKLKRLATKRQEAAINRGFAIMDNRIAAPTNLLKVTWVYRQRRGLAG